MVVLILNQSMFVCMYVCRSRQMSRLHSGSQRMMIMMMKFAKINPQRQKNILTQLQNKFLQNTKNSDPQN